MEMKDDEKRFLKKFLIVHGVVFLRGFVVYHFDTVLGFFVFFYVLALLLCLPLIFYSCMKYRDRCRKANRIAESLGLRYEEEATLMLIKRYTFLNMPQAVVKRSTSQGGVWGVFSGNYRGHDLFYFNLKVDVTLFSCGIVTIKKKFPELRVWPVKAAASGMKVFPSDLPEQELESMEFMKQFEVRCKTKKFCFDVLTPRMMELLQEHGKVWFEIERNAFFLAFPKPLDLDKLKQELDRLVRFRELVPDYLFSEGVEYPKNQG